MATVTVPASSTEVIEHLLLVEVRNILTRSATEFVWVAGSNKFILEGAFTYAGGRPLGTVSTVKLDLSNDGSDDMTVVFDTPQDTLADITSGDRDRFWKALFSGADTFKLAGGSPYESVNLAADGRDVADGATVKGGADNITLSGSSAWFHGDFRQIGRGATVTGGDDIITLDFSSAVPGSGYSVITGDALFSIGNSSTLIGGDDTIIDIGEDIPYTTHEISGDAAGLPNKVIAGDDIITGNNIIIFAYGDGEWHGGGKTSSFVGGHDVITGSKKADLLVGDVGSAYRLSGSYVLGDDTIDGGDGNDRIFGDFIQFTRMSSPTVSGGNDILNGGAGNDLIDGGIGDDLINGGTGSDTASYQSALSAVTVSLTRQNVGQDTIGAGVDVLKSIENLTGSQFNDMLMGTSKANVLNGLDGEDTLVAGLGFDELNGGTGDDMLDGGIQRDTISGDEGDDLIFGGYGNDVIDGGPGVDTVDYNGFGGNVTVNLNKSVSPQTLGGGGVDIISNVENIIAGAYADRLTGRSVDSKIEGGGGSDHIFGIGGDDQLFGEGANDFIQGGNGDDFIDGGIGRDRLNGGNDNDTILGGEDNSRDRLTGAAGDDILDGGGGADILRGDSRVGGVPMTGGADVFDFNEVSDSLTGGQQDIIRDFVQGEDLIDLSDIDAIIGGSDDSFIFLGTAAFSGTAGELRYQVAGGDTTVLADVDGDATADFQIDLNGIYTLLATDFIL